MSPDKNLGLSSWYAIHKKDQLKDAVLNSSPGNVRAAGGIIEDRIKALFGDEPDEMNSLLNYLQSLTPRRHPTSHNKKK